MPKAGRWRGKQKGTHLFSGQTPPGPLTFTHATQCTTMRRLVARGPSVRLEWLPASDGATFRLTVDAPATRSATRNKQPISCVPFVRLAANNSLESDMAYFFYNTDAGQNRFQILIKRGIAATGGPRRFGIQLRQLRPLDVLLMYEDRMGIVAVGRVREYWDGKKHTKILYYPPGEPHEYRIKVNWFLNLSSSPISVATIKEKLGYHPRGAVRRIVKRHDEVERMINQFRPKQDVSEELAFLEGEQQAAKNTARNPQLRKAAKKKWGLKCYCCGFDYEVFYGGVAKGLAIVHHLQLFHGSNGKPRKATVKDVRVVCANCHHVLHVEKPPIDVEDLKKQIAQSWTFWSDRGTQSKR